MALLMYPRARTEGILTRGIDGELILYDQERHQAHRLNATAALIWQHSDGQRTITELARLVAQETKGEADERLARLALIELKQAGLLLGGFAGAQTLTRRDALRRAAAVAGLALAPFVTTIVAPTPADAQSGSRGDDVGNGHAEQDEGGEGKSKKGGVKPGHGLGKDKNRGQGPQNPPPKGR